jgi:hypothetical protein
VLKIKEVGIPSLWVICVKKCLERPGLKFLNSIRIEPPLTFVNQHSSFPLPFPILVPVGFLVKGKWGKAWNHTNLLVRSDFFEAFFRNNLKRDNCSAVNWIGLSISKPALPNCSENFLFLLVSIVLFFCFLLYMKWRGWRSS